MYATLDEWIGREAIPFSLDLPQVFNAAADKIAASLDTSVELLGFGEALHGGEDILIVRNRLFQRLVEKHGYRALALESGFPQAHIINDYVAGSGPDSFEAVQDTGFSHGFGRLEANRELVEWMRSYNAEPSHGVKLRFYGIDMPLLAAGGQASPGQVLPFVLDYLASIDEVSAQEQRSRIDPLLGLPALEIGSLPVRSGSVKKPTYMLPLNPQAFTDFDWWMVLDSTAYSRGGLPLTR